MTRGVRYQETAAILYSMLGTVDSSIGGALTFAGDEALVPSRGPFLLAGLFGEFDDGLLALERGPTMGSPGFVSYPSIGC